MQHRPHPMGLLLGALLLTSCVEVMPRSESTPSAVVETPWSCTEVVDLRLEAFPFRASEEAVSTWVQQEIGVQSTAIQGGPSAFGNGYVKYWRVGQRWYEVSQWSDGRDSVLVKTGWDGSAPSLAEALRCFGQPSLYRAYLAMTPGGYWTCLDLWYPERGLLVSSCVTRKATRITPEQAVADISYVQPGTLSELIPRFTAGISPGSERYTQIERSLKPWPGDISRIAIDDRG